MCNAVNLFLKTGPKIRAVHLLARIQTAILHTTEFNPKKFELPASSRCCEFSKKDCDTFI